MSNVIAERVKACIEKHPDWDDSHVANSIRGARLDFIKRVRAGEVFLEDTPSKPSTPGVISLEAVRKRYDTLSAIRQEIEKIPPGKIITERELCLRTSGKDAARFRKTVENNPEEVKPFRVKLKLDPDASDGQWYWGSSADIREVIRLRDE